jgi:hypothetical protein
MGQTILRPTGQVIGEAVHWEGARGFDDSLTGWASS